MTTVNYVLGFDVGLYSVGCCALEVDESGNPIRILSAVSHIHDSGVGPDGQKAGKSRKATAGVARRTRRTVRRKARRLKALETFLEGQHWKTVPFADYRDPYRPWIVRAELATRPINDPDELGEKLSIAFRHIAAHRGWRNPYASIKSLYTESKDSPAFKALKKKIQEASGIEIPAGATVGQAICLVELGKIKLRGKTHALLPARLFQSDFANEVWRIAKVQGLSEEITKQVIDQIFTMVSPKGANLSRVADDPLDEDKKRALKATNEFQRFRIANTVSNLRIHDTQSRSLTSKEIQKVFNYLLKADIENRPSWNDVADLLDIPRNKLRGTAARTDDGEVLRNQPPIHETENIFAGCTVKAVREFWQQAPQEEKDQLVQFISNGGAPKMESQPGQIVADFISSLNDKDIAKLEKIKLPIGRASYSETTLQTLTNRMLDTGEDLTQARSSCFNVAPTWVPPKPAIYEPVGNPAVDRVLKIVNRFLLNAERQWGQPLSVNIENVRGGFSSVKVNRGIDKQNQKRAESNLTARTQVAHNLGLSTIPARSAVRRYQTLQMQKGKCLYCGQPLDLNFFEMDHIVPRAGLGSTNKRENLVAVCSSCNRSKGDTPFAIWASENSNPEISVEKAIKRTTFWKHDSSMGDKEFEKYLKKVQKRLKRKDIDEQIDARSIESVGWMANELRARISQYFNAQSTNSRTDVRVFRGSITAQARLASGIEKRLTYIDGPGKSRLDRRHHAVDAAVISLMSSYVAETLTLRENLKISQRAIDAPNKTWKQFKGEDAAHRIAFMNWTKKMHSLADLLQQALNDDTIPVTKNLRLRFENGPIHDDKPEPMVKIRVSDEITADEIRRSASEAQWVALTHQPDFDPATGLPADRHREIRIHGEHLGPQDDIFFFESNSAMIRVPQGAVKIGNSIHHARVYKYPGKKKDEFGILRVFAIDLLKHRHEDLFTVGLKPQTVTMRYADPAVAAAIQDGTAEYLGWLVTDDELYIPNIEKIASKQVHTLFDMYGVIYRWTIDGFDSPINLRLRPRLLSKEGLADDAPADIRKILDSHGWRKASNGLFQSGGIQVVRRTALGKPRFKCDAHFPVTWEVK